MEKQTPILSGYGFNTTAEEIASHYNLTGKVVVVTGGSTGIGLETARVLAKAHATVIVGARDLTKAKTNLTFLPEEQILPLDLSDTDSIDAFAISFLRKFERLDILINNAGIMATPLLRDKRGYEMQFATNHLGHFQLTKMLWPALEKARKARIVNLSSSGHRFGPVDFEDLQCERKPYDKWKAYGQSKSANVLFTVELDRRGEKIGISSFAVHPGRIITTELLRYTDEEELKKLGIYVENGVRKGSSGTKTIEEGAATTIWCALSKDLEGKGGVYCENCDIAPLLPTEDMSPRGVRQHAIDPTLAKKLWDISEKLI